MTTVPTGPEVPHTPFEPGSAPVHFARHLPDGGRTWDPSDPDFASRGGDTSLASGADIGRTVLGSDLSEQTVLLGGGGERRSKTQEILDLPDTSRLTAEEIARLPGSSELIPGRSVDRLSKSRGEVVTWRVSDTFIFDPGSQEFYVIITDPNASSDQTGRVAMSHGAALEGVMRRRYSDPADYASARERMEKEDNRYSHGFPARFFS